MSKIVIDATPVVKQHVIDLRLMHGPRGEKGEQGPKYDDTQLRAELVGDINAGLEAVLNAK